MDSLQVATSSGCERNERSTTELISVACVTLVYSIELPAVRTYGDYPRGPCQNLIRAHTRLKAKKSGGYNDDRFSFLLSRKPQLFDMHEHVSRIGIHPKRSRAFQFVLTVTSR